MFYSEGGPALDGARTATGFSRRGVGRVIYWGYDIRIFSFGIAPEAATYPSCRKPRMSLGDDTEKRLRGEMELGV